MGKVALFKGKNVNAKVLVRCGSDLRAPGTRDAEKFKVTTEQGTLHHLVPWKQLGRVLAAAINGYRINHDEDLIELLVHACYCYQPTLVADRFIRLLPALQSLSVIDGADVEVDTTIEGYKTGHLPSSAGKAETVVDLVNHWCWMPGNLFVGKDPSNRGDDPGDSGFDFPPEAAEVGEPEKNASVITKARIGALHEFYSFVEALDDDALWNDDTVRGQLCEHLKELRKFSLGSGSRLMVSKHKDWKEIATSRFIVKAPLCFTKKMSDEYNEILNMRAEEWTQQENRRLKAEEQLKKMLEKQGNSTDFDVGGLFD